MLKRKRRCLRCRDDFTSAWISNRVCPKCKDGSDWRGGNDFAIALRAPRQAWLSETGTMRFDPAMENGFSWLLEAAQRLAARLIVVRTGPELTPGQRDRDRLQTYFERFPRIDGQILVWHPTGLWEADAAQEAAARMQVVGAVDALEESPPSGPVTYSTLVARGARQSFSHHDLEGVVHKLAGAGVHEAFVAIDSPRSFQEATLLQTLATKAA